MARTETIGNVPNAELMRVTQEFEALGATAAVTPDGADSLSMAAMFARSSAASAHAAAAQAHASAAQAHASAAQAHASVAHANIRSNPTRYIGFDVATYPGDGTVGWLWTHGFRVAGFYLNHHRGGEDDSWIPRRSELVNVGWGLAPLYLGWQTVDNQGRHLPPPSDPSTTAVDDAAEAARLMAKAGFPAGSVVFFDIEDGTVPQGNYDTYLQTWFSVLRDGKFLPAVYCSHNLIAWASGKGVPCWSFHIPFKKGGPYDPDDLPVALDAGCMGTQFRQEAHLNGLPLALDLNCFVVPDPSTPNAAARLVA